MSWTLASRDSLRTSQAIDGPLSVAPSVQMQTLLKFTRSFEMEKSGFCREPYFSGSLRLSPYRTMYLFPCTCTENDGVSTGLE